MKKIICLATLLILLPFYSTTWAETETDKNEYVILLHGMGRTAFSMRKMARFLEKSGYTTINITYPSTSEPVPVIAETLIKDTINECLDKGASKIHVVTHSLGGIVIRQYLQNHSLPEGSRIVMIGPPNKGSEVADFLMDFKPYKWAMGDAGQSLGTAEESLVNTLKPVHAEIGIIAGTRTVAPWCSLLLPGPNDGKVAVEKTKLGEMSDFISVPVSHPFMTSRKAVMSQTLHFLNNGRFFKNI